MSNDFWPRATEENTPKQAKDITNNIKGRTDEFVVFENRHRPWGCRLTMILLATSFTASVMTCGPSDSRAYPQDMISHVDSLQAIAQGQVAARVGVSSLDSIQEEILADSAKSAMPEDSHDLNKDIGDINRRINDIVAFQKNKDPWYRDTGILISAAAFFVSIVTSGLSAYRTYRQDINSRKEALQSVIQQYHTIMIDNISKQHEIAKERYEIQWDPNSSRGGGYAQTIQDNSNRGLPKPNVASAENTNTANPNADIGNLTTFPGRSFAVLEEARRASSH